jgi:hypothetical protein
MSVTNLTYFFISCDKAKTANKSGVGKMKHLKLTFVFYICTCSGEVKRQASLLIAVTISIFRLVY